MVKTTTEPPTVAPEPITDTERLDWIEAHMNGAGLISDDAGNWAASFAGMQTLPCNPPQDIHSSFFVEASEWRPSIREAIDAAMRENNTDA